VHGGAPGGRAKNADPGPQKMPCSSQSNHRGREKFRAWNIRLTRRFVFLLQARFQARLNFGSLFMSLINVVIALVVVGVILWLINNYIPMDGKIKNILNIVVVIAVILWLLRAFGLLTSLGGM
jgi:hypothetical protein